MTFTLNQIIFACFSHFSGTTMYDSVLYTVFNVFFTSVPIVVYSGYDRDVSLKSMMETPELFDMDGKRDWLQSYPRFLLNLLLGVAHAFIAFFLTYLICSPFQTSSGFQITQQEFASIIYMAVVTIANVRVAGLCNYWTWMHWLFIIGSVLIFPLIFLIVDYMHLSPTIRYVSLRVCQMPHFWLVMIASALVTGIPLVLQTVIERGRNTLLNRVLYKEKVKSRLNRIEKRNSMKMIQNNRLL